MVWYVNYISIKLIKNVKNVKQCLCVCVCVCVCVCGFQGLAKKTGVQKMFTE